MNYKDEDYELVGLQAKSMSKFITDFIYKISTFEKKVISEKVFDDFESLLKDFLHEEYKSGNRIHLTSDFLGQKKWDKFEQLFDILEIPEILLLKNLYFEFSEEFTGDVFAYSTTLGKVLRLGEFNMNSNGEIVYMFSHIDKRFDPLTNICNAAWMISNQAKRKIKNEEKNPVSDSKTRQEIQEELELLFSDSKYDDYEK